MSAVGERNKRTAVRFLELAFVRGEPELAVETCIGAGYVQHNPDAADGQAGFLRHARAWFERSGGAEVSHKRAIAEGDHVVLHSEVKERSGGAALAVVDIFRFDESGRIVEHWDVVQEIPARLAHDNGMV